jgi:HD-GYP domain-containing protein (c-di-GMP phosphodiesterase class II)
MTGTRPYRAAVSPDEALTELQANSGTQFDARCVQALVEVVRDTAVVELDDAPREREPSCAVTRVATSVRAA